jgi:hypothetical protein
MKLSVSRGYINALDVDFFLFLFLSPPHPYHLDHHPIFVNLVPRIT